MKIDSFGFGCTTIAAIFASLSAMSFPAIAAKGTAERIVGQVSEAVGSREVAATGTLEVGFSPNGGAETLVLRVIDSADKDLKVLAYSFTSAKVTSALLRAIRRGVKVTLVADAKNNMGEGSSRNARSAFSALVEAGADVRLVSAFPIHHDKLIVADGKNLQTGSFNYSQAAATKNSEYVLVNWNNPALARAFQDHFERNWRLGVPFTAGY